MWDLDGQETAIFRLRSPGVSVCWHPEEVFKVRYLVVGALCHGPVSIPKEMALWVNVIVKEDLVIAGEKVDGVGYKHQIP